MTFTNRISTTKVSFDSIENPYRVIEMRTRTSRPALSCYAKGMMESDRGCGAADIQSGDY